jgi:hypothetical protein
MAVRHQHVQFVNIIVDNKSVSVSISIRPNKIGEPNTMWLGRSNLASDASLSCLSSSARSIGDNI